MRKTQLPELGDNHRRGIWATLSLLDEALCEFEQWAGGRETQSVLYEERNTLSRSQRRRLLRTIEAMRQVLREVRDRLDLAVSVQDASQAIWGRCSALREHLAEPEGKHLRRYGEPSDELAQYLDPKVHDLLRGLEQIVGVLGTGELSDAPGKP